MKESGSQMNHYMPGIMAEDHIRRMAAECFDVPVVNPILETEANLQLPFQAHVDFVFYVYRNVFLKLTINGIAFAMKIAESDRMPSIAPINLNSTWITFTDKL